MAILLGAWSGGLTTNMKQKNSGSMNLPQQGSSNALDVQILLRLPAAGTPGCADREELAQAAAKLP